MLSEGYRSRVGCCAAVLLATLSLAVLGGQSTQASPSGKQARLRASLRAELNRYLSTRRAAEHISAVSLRVTFHGHRRSINLAVGTTRYGGRRRVSTDGLWQIGSNTKAFTSVVLLQLEAEHKLSIYDTVGKWLPRYAAWRRITIKRLLNMTSGIQDYGEQPAFFRDYAAAPNTVFSASRLVSYAVGLPLLKGLNYSNTNYILAQMIIARAAHDTYGHQLRRRIIIPLGLKDLFFSATRYPRAVTDRLPAGYFFDSSVPHMTSQLGKDQRRRPLSWVQGAGGIVSSLQDMTKWDRALYRGRLLPRKQQRELKSLVSAKTGRPIRTVTPADPGGFGLGVQRGIGSLGMFWTYEGSTLGYRVEHVYWPRSGVLLALGVNSATNDDQLETLAAVVYHILHRAGEA
jgi:D-alanyl-D-alanine carboxypeptidase